MQKLLGAGPLATSGSTFITNASLRAPQRSSSSREVFLALVVITVLLCSFYGAAMFDEPMAETAALHAS